MANRAERRAKAAQARHASPGGLAEAAPTTYSGTCPGCGSDKGPWYTMARRNGREVHIGIACRCKRIVSWKPDVIQLPGDLSEEEYRAYMARQFPKGQQSN